MEPATLAHQGLASPIDSLDDFSVGARGALRHQIVRRLLHAIFRGHLPAGTRLTVMKLARRFGTSSTPVREALVELEAIGVVHFMHNRGAVVAPFGRRELREIYQIRRVLEAEAARSACGKVDAETLTSIIAEIVALRAESNGAEWSQRATAADRRLHEVIVQACGSARLAGEIRRYETLVQTIREIIGHDRPAQQRALDEHLAIADALLRGDASDATAAMSRHIDGAAEVCERAMFGER